MTSTPEESSKGYYLIWEDVIEVGDLRKAVVVSLIALILAFLVGQQLFIASGWFNPSLGKGYALMFVLVVLTVVAGILCKLIQPKRIFEEKEMRATLGDPGIYPFVDLTLEEEKEVVLKNLDKLPKDLVEEMKRAFGPDPERWFE